MRRSKERILTTHTGSLPRPEKLEKAMLATLEGKAADAGEMESLVREATSEVVRRQAACGVDVVSDGEVSKPGYATYVQDRLTGFGGQPADLVIRDFMDYPEAAAELMTDPGFTHLVHPGCDAPVSRRDSDALEKDIARLRQALAGTDVTEAFMTAVSPGTIAMFHENQYYGSQEEYLQALADAMRPEYRAIVEAGFILQVDCPDLAAGHVLSPETGPDEIKRKIGLSLEALDAALEGLPADRMRMHVCWGNYEGPHHTDIPLAEIVGQVLQARPQGLLIEGANPRHEHEWQVFEDVPLPDGKVLIPGVVDTTNNYIEHPELIAQRIGRYAKIVGRENVMAGTDCGFGTFVGLHSTAPSIAWAKLEAMKQGAELATGQLWLGERLVRAAARLGAAAG